MLSVARLDFDKLDAFCQDNRIPVDDIPVKTLKKAEQPRYPKRSIPKISYKEEDVPSDDEFLFCDLCGDEYEGPCPIHGPMLLVCDQKIRKGGRTDHFIEGADEKSSNWLRFVNCANVEEKQNLVAFQFRKDVYYRTYKPVLEFTELFVWYGDAYGRELGAQIKRKISLSLEVKPKEVTGVECDLCHALFSSPEVMEKHRKRHPHMGPDRRHRCPHCEYSTDDAGNMRRHLAAHDGVKSHKCPECGRAFTHKHNLARHVRTHTGERPFQCDECGKEFTRKSSLLTHERIHSGEQPFLCSECGKGFTNQSSLVFHLRTHTGQRPYRCTQCPYRSAQSSRLKKHVIAQHSKDYPHVCEECGKGFVKPSRMIKHKTKAHKNN
ncbi:histone-lysine N-methyltransferase PRDM9-like [Uloborus diversus]|uniref:histone-lysine N-methyltransferase PRDM9-like n=1 Tax=Uloborus diversus TaxID=327109 RepID=UPI002409DEBE|nr:histone-lysine N-methyltransferase PRDM9-like [Uloborus diversus]